MPVKHNVLADALKNVIYVHVICHVRCHAGSAWQLRTRELRTQKCSQGSSWVSGLLVGVRWRSSPTPIP